MACPNDGYCWGNAGEGPCKSERPTEPACAADDYLCVDFGCGVCVCLPAACLSVAACVHVEPPAAASWPPNCRPRTPCRTYCHGNVTFECPGDQVCKGSFPCSIQPDDTCDGADNSCLNSSSTDYCLGGERLTCPEGYRCSAAAGERGNPCIPAASELPLCWADVEDNTCLDNSHYCSQGYEQWCGEGKYCNPAALETGAVPCSSEPPSGATECSEPEFSCIDESCVGGGGCTGCWGAYWV